MQFMSVLHVPIQYLQWFVRSAARFRGWMCFLLQCLIELVGMAIRVQEQLFTNVEANLMRVLERCQFHMATNFATL